MRTKLFVIKQRGGSLYWTCSSEHGCGWSDGPKQSFSPSELSRELLRMIEADQFPGAEVCELVLLEDPSCEKDRYTDQAPMHAVSNRCPACGRRQ